MSFNPKLSLKSARREFNLVTSKAGDSFFRHHITKMVRIARYALHTDKDNPA